MKIFKSGGGAVACGEERGEGAPGTNGTPGGKLTLSSFG